MTSLFAGVVLLACSVLLYLALRWGTDRPQQVWMHENLVAMVYTPLVVGLLAFGLAFIIQFFMMAT